MRVVLATAGVVSNVVQHVLVPVVDSRLCNRLYEKIADKVKLDISDDMMCAGIEEGGRDACQVTVRQLVVQYKSKAAFTPGQMLPDTSCIHLYSLVAVNMFLVSAACRPSVAGYKGIQVDRDINE